MKECNIKMERKTNYQIKKENKGRKYKDRNKKISKKERKKGMRRKGQKNTKKKERREKGKERKVYWCVNHSDQMNSDSEKQERQRRTGNSCCQHNSVTGSSTGSSALDPRW